MTVMKAIFTMALPNDNPLSALMGQGGNSCSFEVEFLVEDDESARDHGRAYRGLMMAFIEGFSEESVS